jgi:preprotein translocase subunit YajC
VHTTLFALSLAHPGAAVGAASTGTTSSGGGGSSFVPFLVLIALFGVAYFAFLRPARNRQRAAVQQRREVEVGDEVTTTAGLIATVVAVDDDFLTLEVAPGVHCRYLPAAVLRVNGDDDTDQPDDETDEAADVTNHEVIERPTDDTGNTGGDATTDPTDGPTSA